MKRIVTYDTVDHNQIWKGIQAYMAQVSLPESRSGQACVKFEGKIFETEECLWDWIKDQSSLIDIAAIGDMTSAYILARQYLIKKQGVFSEPQYSWCNIEKPSFPSLSQIERRLTMHESSESLGHILMEGPLFSGLLEEKYHISICPTCLPNVINKTGHRNIKYFSHAFEIIDLYLDLESTHSSNKT